MYGIPHLGMIANKILTERLANHGYCPCEITTGIWKYDMNTAKFFLTVDGFGFNYVYK